MTPTDQPAPGFFAFARYLQHLWPDRSSPDEDHLSLPAADRSEMNNREANFLGWLTLASWIAFVSALLPDMHWVIHWPLAIITAFFALQLFTIAVALVLQKKMIATGKCSPGGAREWHTRGQVVLLVVISAAIFGLGLGTPFLRTLAKVWVILAILNLCAGLQEQAKQRKQ